MKERLKRAVMMSGFVSVIATAGMVLIPRLTSPEEFINAPSIPVHLLISFVAVFVVSVPISVVFYWLRDSLRR